MVNLLGLITVDGLWIGHLAPGENPIISGHDAAIGSIFVSSTDGTIYVKTGSGLNDYDVAITQDSTNSITSLGTVTTGVWNASVIGQQYGGSGVNNGGTLTWGANNITFSTSGVTSLTLPTSGTLATESFVTSQGYLTANQTITMTGDISGSGTTSIVTTLATVNANVFATNTFLKFAVNEKGLVTSAISVAGSDIISTLGYTPVNVAGDTMTGNLAFGGSYTAIGLAEPTNASDAATKNYVDNAVTGLSWKQAAHVATTGPVNLATDLVNGATIDGHVVNTGDRVLVKDQTDPKENGIYDVVASGVAVRSADANTGAELFGASVFVSQGTVNANSGWTQTTAAPITIGVSNIVWVQFSGAGAYSAGAGLDLTGTVFSINFGAGIAQLPSDEVGIDIFDYVNSAIGFMDNLGTRVATLGAASTGDTLSLFLDTLVFTQVGGELTIVDGGITATHINVSAIGAGLSGGGGSTIEVNTDNVTTYIDTNNFVAVKGTNVMGQALVSDGSGAAVWSTLQLNNPNAVFGTLPTDNGGTGFNTYAEGDLLVGTGTNSLYQLHVGTVGQVLTSDGSTPIWSTIDVTSVTGILPVANGGTGVSAFGGVNTILYTTTANTLASITSANNGVLITSGIGAPSIADTLPSLVQGNITSLGTVTSGTIGVGTIVSVNDNDFSLINNTGDSIIIDGANVTGNVTLKVADITSGTISVKDNILRNNSLTTNDNTSTTVLTIPTATGNSYMIKANVIGYKLSGAGSGAVGATNGYVRDIIVKNIGGTVTIVGNQSTMTFEDIAAHNVTVTTSGTNILVQVTGSTNNNIKWNAIAEVYNLVA